MSPEIIADMESMFDGVRFIDITKAALLKNTDMKVVLSTARVMFSFRAGLADQDLCHHAVVVRGGVWCADARILSVAGAVAGR